MAQPAVAATAKAMKSAKRRLPRRAAVMLTQAALNKVKSYMAENKDAIGLKVGVKTRGCNGLSYVMEYAKEKGKLDEEVVQDGVRIFIDSKAQLTLLGTEMDYVDTNLQKEFVFNNPNAKGSCGCGESFHV